MTLAELTVAAGAKPVPFMYAYESTRTGSIHAISPTPAYDKQSMRELRIREVPLYRVDPE